VLGIRLHRGVQVDLHQGDLGIFVADAFVIPCDTSLNPVGPVAEGVFSKSGLQNPLESNASRAAIASEVIITDAGRLPATYLIYARTIDWGRESQDLLSLEAALEASYLESFRTFSKSGKRHLAVSPLALDGSLVSPDRGAVLALQALRAFLDVLDFGQFRRVSFVLSSAEEYQVFRKAMFSTFPEADQE
jgi:O-acetyl-ADP-ribose deacetylase (regulator of RNase III)